MGMKLKRIEYHQERARIAWRQHYAREPVSQGAVRYGSHRDRAEYHDRLAMELFIDGLRDYAKLSNCPRAKYARKYRARIGSDPRTDPAVAGRGRGSRNRGKLDWGSHATRKKKKPNPVP